MNDAKAMKTALLKSKSVVEVFDIYDCDATKLNSKVDDFVNSLQEGDAALVFFACHGVEYNNAIRLLAIPQSGKPDLKTDALNLLVLLERLVTYNRSYTCEIIILCHNLTELLSERPV